MKWTLRFILTLALLVVTVVPSYAVFNDAEKIEYTKLVTVNSDINAALTELSYAHVSGQDTAAVIKSATVLTNTAGRESESTMTLLMNGNHEAAFTPPLPPGDPGYAAFRAERLATARFHHSRIESFIVQARAALANATGSNSIRARDIWLKQALDLTTTFDWTLPFFDPCPTAACITLIGPHGEFNLAHWGTWRGSFYARDVLESAMADYPQVGVDWYALITKSAPLFNGIVHGMARIADIDTSQAERDIRWQLTTLPAGPFGTQFFLLLRYFQTASDSDAPGVGIPGRYHELQDALTRDKPIITDGLAFALRRLTDSWKHFQKGIDWHAALAFPGCDMVNQPMGCAQKLPSQQQPVGGAPKLPSQQTSPSDSSTTTTISIAKKTGRNPATTIVSVVGSVNLTSVVITVDGVEKVNVKTNAVTYSTPLPLPNATAVVKIIVVNKAGDTTVATATL